MQAPDKIRELSQSLSGDDSPERIFRKMRKPFAELVRALDRLADVTGKDLHWGRANDSLNDFYVLVEAMVEED